MTGFARLLAVAGLILGLGVAEAQQTVAVERRSAAATVAWSAVGGLVLGSAVAGGVILYERGIDDNEDYDWKEALAWGAGAGLAAGLVWGLVRATNDASTYGRIPPLEARDGHSVTLDLRRKDQSGRVTFSLLRKRF